MPASEAQVMGRCRKYLPLRSIDADDLRQELAVAELSGRDPSHHVWSVLRRVVRGESRGRTSSVEPGRRDDDSLSGDDLISRLGLPDDVAAEVRSYYETGEYPGELRYQLRAAGKRLKRETYV